MTTAVAGRLRGPALRGRRRWVMLGGLVTLLVAGALAVHLAMPSWYARLWYPMEHANAITGEAAASGVPSDLIAAVIYRESKFSETARSGRGAVGLMQVLPATAEWIHRQRGAPSAEPGRLAEPEVNIAYGAWYLHYLLDRYGSEDLALVAYNGGETNLQKWLDTARQDGKPLRLADVPFSETRNFVTAVHDARSVYRRAWASSLRAPNAR